MTIENSGAGPAATAIRAIVVAVALGEIAVGVLAALFPGPVFGLLLQAPIEGNALVVARMVGVSIAALGCTWWAARNEAPAVMPRLLTGGFLVYNIGVAIVFLAYAGSLDGRRWIPLAVALAHLLIGATFALAVRRSRATARAA